MKPLLAALLASLLGCLAAAGALQANELESPAMAAKVAAGELPPLSERLPIVSVAVLPRSTATTGPAPPVGATNRAVTAFVLGSTVAEKRAPGRPSVNAKAPESCAPEVDSRVRLPAGPDVTAVSGAML